MSERPTFRTQLCDMLEIEYPIMLAGMGSMGKATPPALVAAVSNAGGMGVIGGAGLEPPQLGCSSGCEPWFSSASGSPPSGCAMLRESKRSAPVSFGLQGEGKKESFWPSFGWVGGHLHTSIF